MIKPSEYTALKHLAVKATPHWKRFYSQHKKKLEGMDLVVHGLHERYAERVDCLQCARCCKTLGPRIEPKDIDRIARALRQKNAEVEARFFKIDEDGDTVFKSMPCPFLDNDNYCRIYESRPKACREYPHTDRKRFYQIYQLTVKNAETCPIVYEVLNELTRP